MNPPVATETTTMAVSLARLAPIQPVKLSTPIGLKRPHWQDIAQRQHDQVYSSIPKQYMVPSALLQGKHLIRLPESCGILNERELGITSLTATSLLKALHHETYTAVEVTRAFCKRAAIAHQATNCLAVVMFDEALRDAAALDSYMQTHHRPIGPLHGLPISVKEHILLAGTPSTSGFVAWADSMSSTDALIVKILREAGAVFHCKTTNPQALMALETSSNLYGTTTNPHNTDLTPGGSSGGEGALIAMRGSLLGIGTDIGGSIRTPSAFSGIYGLKPSVARIPHGGLAGVHSGMENIIGVVGPMATCVEDMRLFCKVVLDSQPWLYEPTLVEIRWKNSIQLPKSLRIGVMYHDNVVQPHPPVSAVLQESVAALEKAGHTIIPWNPQQLHLDLVTCINHAYFLDGGEEYYEVLDAGNEPPTPLMSWLLSYANAKPWQVRDTWKLNKRIDALKLAYASAWNTLSLDCLLCPVNPSAASAHGESKYWGYTSVFNLLDYSGSVFPVRSVRATDTLQNYPPRQESPFNNEDTLLRAFYTGPEKYCGAQVSLQLVTRRYREESLLDMTEAVVAVLEKEAATQVVGTDLWTPHGNL